MQIASHALNYVVVFRRVLKGDRDGLFKLKFYWIV
jgi:hypothetical protein